MTEQLNNNRRIRKKNEKANQEIAKKIDRCDIYNVRGKKSVSATDQKRNGCNTSDKQSAHMCTHLLSRVFATPWAVVRKTPLSMGFLRQEYWSGLPFPPARALPHPGIRCIPLASLALAGRFLAMSAT